MKKIIKLKLISLCIAICSVLSFTPVFAGTATIFGWAKGIDGNVYIVARSGSTYVNWYISSASGYSLWSYCKGIGTLSTGRKFYTTAAYA